MLLITIKSHINGEGVPLSSVIASLRNFIWKDAGGQRREESYIKMEAEIKGKQPQT